LQLLPILLAVPYIHLQIEVLRRPVEFAQHPPVAVLTASGSSGGIDRLGAVADVGDGLAELAGANR